MTGAGSTPHFRCEIRGAVATITLDRPDARNAMSSEMATGLTARLETLAAQSDVRIVVLTGAGNRFFCPGADLAGSAAAGAPGQATGSATEGLSARTIRASVLLHAMPQVTIAAINGSAAGAGFGLAAACDVRVASSTAMFNTAFLDVGVAGDFGLAWSLTRIVGPARARELFLLRQKFTAADALRFGIVSDVYEEHEFRGEVASIVDRLSRAVPEALLAIKANFLSAGSLDFPEYFDIETERHFVLVNRPAFRQGAAAFRSQQRG